MIKEYIDKLIAENNQSLENLEKEMKELISDLESSRKWLEKLQREKNLDTNIFSPRNMDTEIKEKMEKAQLEINKINHNIEHTRIMMEEHVKKKLEYEKLLLETKETEEAEQNLGGELRAEAVRKFLSDLYTKTEICLATLNGDQNKCRNELKNMKYMIKNYVREIEKN